MTPTRSAIDRASDWSWVTNRVVIPSRCCRLRISARSWARTRASSADSGSSSSRTVGSIASARAIATRCCCPPDSWYGYRLAVSESPTSSSSSSARLRRVRLVLTPHPQAEGDVGAHVHVGEQAVGLEHHPHVALVRRHVGDVAVVDEHSARVRAVESAEDPQRRRLAAAGRTEQRDQLAVLDLEVEARERGHPREDALDAFESDHQKTRAAPPPRRRCARNDRMNRSRNVNTSVSIESATETPTWL